ncbi:hypothetical protein [Shigella sonnei]|nr:hypothetical protein [Shigella sonnei]SRV82742.1 transposase family [Shigella sonnei]
MSRKTQRYSKEFKAEAVRTVPENQLSIWCIQERLLQLGTA